MKLLIFGLGYTASHFVRLQGGRFAAVTGTYRSLGQDEAVPPLLDVVKLPFDGLGSTPEIEAAIAQATHILVSIPPDEEGDPVLRHFREALRAAPNLQWIGYLSTVGVYGNADGAWIDESAPLRPTSARNAMRVTMEREWLALGKPIQLFRLAGIYGPGRNAMVNLRKGRARRVIKAGQVFNRVHVEDIASAVMAGIERPQTGPFINLTDNEPAPPQDVIAYAAKLLGVPVPPDIPYSEATMTPMARSFYGENKRVSNRRMREELECEPKYPTYREGIKACADGM